MTESQQLRRTPLHALHVDAGARMMAFAGWDMPVQYEGIIAEHMAVRTSAGLFDVSHMGQLRVSGTASIAALQEQLSNDLDRIGQIGSAQYSLLCNDQAGIEDDLIVYRLAADELLLVVNAANRAHDASLLDGIATDESDGWAMLALQGPKALEVLAEVAGADLRERGSFEFDGAIIAGHACIVATTGYTGERGCELLVPADGAADVWRLLMADERVTACGLGARDTLRLEACFPLHGSDIGPDTDPFAAGLGFAAPVTVDGPVGAHAALARAREQQPQRRLVPLLVSGRGIPRAGARVLVDGADVGSVTSGTMSPVLRQGIALAWIDAAHATVDNDVLLQVRERSMPARVMRRPLVG